MAFEDNIFNSPLDTGGPLWADEIDYGSSGWGGMSDSWENLIQGSISKGLDYFIQKDLYETKSAVMPASYPQQYVRGADGRLYQSNGMPVQAYPSSGAGGMNPLLLLAIAAGVYLLVKA